MTIGTGIAIAGAWIFAGIMGASKNTTNSGAYLSIFIAFVVSALLASI